MEYLEPTPEEIAAKFLRNRDAMAADSPGKLTASKVLAQGNLLASALREKPADAPAMPMPDRGRMSINELYRQLEDLSTKPLDYTAVESANRSKRDAARKDIGAGLMLAFRGDAPMASAGGHILQQALSDAKPLRMNAADMAYEGADGRMVENPGVERASREKVIAGRIDAQIKEQQFLYQQATLANDRALRETASRNLERLMAMKIAPTIVLANAAETRAGNAGAGKGLKAISASQQRDLDSKTTTAEGLSKLYDSFKDEYAGKGAMGAPAVAIGSALGSWAPESKDSVFSRIASDQPTVNWWREFKMMQELPKRHELFGAALTPNEQRSWDRAQAISPNSDPKVVKNTLAQLHKISVDVHRRLSTQLRTEGKNTEAYDLPEGVAESRDPTSGTIKPARRASDAPLSADDAALMNKYLK